MRSASTKPKSTFGPQFGGRHHEVVPVRMFACSDTLDVMSTAVDVLCSCPTKYPLCQGTRRTTSFEYWCIGANINDTKIIVRVNETTKSPCAQSGDGDGEGSGEQWSWVGNRRQGKVRQGKARQGKVKQDKGKGEGGELWG